MTAPSRPGVIVPPDPQTSPPPTVWIYLDRDEAEAILPLLKPHAGRGALRYVHRRVQAALAPPAYRWDVPDVLPAAADAVAALERLWDHPQTFREAQAELHRLEAALHKAGVSVRPPGNGTEWRTGFLQMLWSAGLYKNDDDKEWRILLPADKDGWHPTGPTLRELVDAWRAFTGVGARP